MHDESGAARFEREARATAGLNHPGIVTVHDSGVEDDTAYLVMELLPGPSLAERLREGPLPVAEVVSVGEQVARALDAAHARGLVHRDVKPGNIAYADDGRVRVLDFGITQLGDTAGSQALTATHTVMGTAEYLAPEQAMGGRVDGRADLYALGCVLYALLVGHAPFRGATPVATMMMHANDPVPDVRDLRPDTPDWLADVVSGLLAKDPDARPTGAAAVAAALAGREPVAGSATTVLPAAAAGGAAAASGADDPAARARAAAAGDPRTAALRRPPRRRARPARRPAGGSGLTWLLALVALVAVALLVWQLFGREDDPDPTPSPTPSTSSAAPSTSAPPTSEEPTPTDPPPRRPRRPAPPTPPTSRVTSRTPSARLSDGIDDLDSAGSLEGDSAKKLRDAGARRRARRCAATTTRRRSPRTPTRSPTSSRRGSTTDDHPGGGPAAPAARRGPPHRRRRLRRRATRADATRTRGRPRTSGSGPCRAVSEGGLEPPCPIKGTSTSS